MCSSEHCSYNWVSSRPYSIDIISIPLCLEKGAWHLQFIDGNLPFLNLENVLSPEGTLQSRSQWGPIWDHSILLWSEKGMGHFQVTSGNSPFWNPQNVLFPVGTLRSRTRMESILYSYHFLLSREGCLTLSIYRQKFAVLKYWFCFICWRDGTGWMDGKGRGIKCVLQNFSYFIGI